MCSLFLKFTNNIVECRQYWTLLPIFTKNQPVETSVLSQKVWGVGCSIRGVGVFSKFFKFLHNLRLSLLFSCFFKKTVNGLVSFLYYNFKHGYNILFFDSTFNYNYIPISNKRLLKRGKKNLKKLFRFFRINCVILLNVANKRFIFKKLKKRKMIIFSSESRIWKKFLDFSLPSKNYLSDYLFYLLVILIYKKVKTTTVL